MKISRDGWLGIAILLTLVLVTAAAVVQQNHEPQIAYLSTSSSPSGTRALKLWLNELGRPSSDEIQDAFEPSQNIKTIFIIQPLLPLSEREWSLLDDWIEKGGTLILAGDNRQTNRALEHFDFSLAFLEVQINGLAAASPLLNSPALTSKVPFTADLALSSTRTDYVVLLSAENDPVIVSFQQGKGNVILSSTPYLLSNVALKDDAIALAVLNLIALTGAEGTVWFDEWHHGIQSAAIVGPGQWLRHTPGGHALLFTVGVVFVALLLQGRAFGRPIPLSHEIKRRGSLEHVTAIANLNRKAGYRADVVRQYYQRVKRHLGQRYRLDPSLPDVEYVNLLVQYNPSIDKDGLLNLLKRLSQKKVGELELVKLASEAAQWIKD